MPSDIELKQFHSQKQLREAFFAQWLHVFFTQGNAAFFNADWFPSIKTPSHRRFAPIANAAAHLNDKYWALIDNNRPHVKDSAGSEQATLEHAKIASGTELVIMNLLPLDFPAECGNQYRAERRWLNARFADFCAKNIINSWNSTGPHPFSLRVPPRIVSNHLAWLAALDLNSNAAPFFGNAIFWEMAEEYAKTVAAYIAFRDK